MGAPLTEFVFETVIRDGLGEIKSNPAILDDIFSRFTETHFNNQYGQSKIDQLKTYFSNNQIRIVQSHAMVPTSMPCISIHLQSSAETENLQNMGNNYEQVSDPTTPAVVVPTITPGTYDTITGKLTIINPADLSVVCPGMNFVDNSGTKFGIQSGNSNQAGNKFINIGTGQSPDLGGNGRIESSIDYTLKERRMIRLQEQIRLGCHANDDIHLAKFIFYILTYILKSRQSALITRGISLDWGQGSVYDRADSFEGENVFERYIMVNCLTAFDWDQEQVQVIDCFDPTIKVNDPDPNSEDTVVVSPTEDS